MTSRLRPALLLVAVVASLAAAPASDDPFPVGTCVHVPSVHRAPLCVLVDPGE